MGFFVNEEILLGGVEILIGENLIEESVNISGDKKLKGLKIYLRSKKEATRGGNESIRHGPSFKIYEGNKSLSDIFIYKDGSIKIKNDKNLPKQVSSYVKKFVDKNYKDIIDLWNSTSDTDYDIIVKNIKKHNPSCIVKMNKR